MSAACVSVILTVIMSTTILLSKRPRSIAILDAVVLNFALLAKALLR